MENSISERTKREETQHKARKRIPKVVYRASAKIPMEKHRMWGTGYEGAQNKERKTSSASCDIAGRRFPEKSKAIQVD